MTGTAADRTPTWEVISWQSGPSGLVLQTGCGLIALEARTARAIRIRCTLEAELSLKPSVTVTADAAAAPGFPFEVTEGPETICFSTTAVTIEIDRRTSAFTYRDAVGALLTREPARGGKTLDPIDVLVSVFDEATTVERGVQADGVRVDAVNVRQVVDRQAYHTKLEFEWAPGEALYGLGSHEEGMFNLRGRHQYLYQQNMKASVPVLLSTRGYGVFADCTSLLTFHDDEYGSYLWADVDEELDYYFLVGPEFDTIVGEFRALTGTPPMLPRWAFGYLQSKERYATSDELLEVAREYRARGLPLDCMVLDWKSWPGTLWGQKSLDPERFPDPDQLTADLHALGIRLMVSVWPTMQPGGDDWRELLDGGHMLGNGATYNAFSPAARAVYWDQANRGLFAHGFDAWWADCTEPFESDWMGAVKPEPEERLRINTDEAKRYLDPELINAYSLYHSQGIYEGQRATGSDKRVFNLTRSVYPGQQRYATVTWSGDVSATWDTLRRQVSDGLNFFATGMPYWTTDVGAFFVRRRPDLWFWAGDYDDGVADPGYRELYVRWFQYTSWLPVLRSHGTDTPREVWRFGDVGDPAYEALAAALRLRYQLLPYIYSLAGWTTQRDYTMVRALPFDFREDQGALDVGDEYLFGPAFLVCPVYRPEASTPSRSVYLPAGADWFDFWTDRRLAGGQTVEAEAPLDHLPLYVRAGSIVPMGPARQHADEAPDAPLLIQVYPGHDATFTLYEDAGDGYGYEHGEFACVELEWDDAQRQLTIGARVGAYPAMPAVREVIVTLHVPVADDAADDARTEGVPERSLSYSGQRVVVGF